MRDTADIRMDRDSHYTSAFRSFGIESLKLVLGSTKKLFSLVVLQNHHRDVVQLYTVGKRNEWAVCRLNFVGLIVVDPIGDVLQPGLSQKIESLFGFGEPRAKPS